LANPNKKFETNLSKNNRHSASGCFNILCGKANRKTQTPLPLSKAIVVAPQKTLEAIKKS